MAESSNSAPKRRLPQRTRSNFLTKTAQDAARELDRRFSLMPSNSDIEGLGDIEPQQQSSGKSDNPYEPRSDGDELSTTRLEPYRDDERQHSSNNQRKGGYNFLGDSSLTAQMHNYSNGKSHEHKHKPRAGPRPVGGSDKLGTFSGVFVPTSLNVLSILMFLRFGFILGQSGVLGIMGMLIVSYLINLVTTLSISAIATNGTVRGGGAYYLISRSLGPEFGGSIGIVFYLGFVFNTGMNAVGLIDCFKQNFGVHSGDWANWLPEGFWWEYLFATIVLFICTAICLAGSGIFARCSNGLLAILLVATFSIPLSTFIKSPFENRKMGLEYTGLSAQTFKENLLPRFTKGAAGSQLKGKETYQDLFGILFPATGGIFAGASMSGDLKNPSKSIPKGTLAGLGLTFVAYTLVILAMAATITRPSFYRDLNVIQDTNISGILVLAGELASTFFSSLMGVIGSAKLLQALARDDLLPGFSIFGQGTKENDEPTYAIIITHVVAQLTMLAGINQIASFVTMTYLMTFLVTNLACFLLKISSAPNFRPSFHYFNWYTAAAGTLISGASMFFVDGLYASGCVGILVIIFLIIHYTTPPKSWGDVSQSLIYHQVRKYLLRLRQEHVKFWRPQILLFINDPRRQYKLIQFCNSLKKGALFILGHVIVTPDFGPAVPEARRQQAAWTKYIDFSKIKAFVNIAVSPAVEWGTRNIVLSAGLGGMRPNIVVMGFYNLDQLREDQPLIDVPPPQRSQPSLETTDGSKFEHTRPRSLRKSSSQAKMEGLLPTDICRVEGAVKVTSYLTILEDLLLRLQINVAVAKGFQGLELPDPHGDKNAKKFIDLWPIQMSAEIASEGGEKKQNVLTTNFDTYTLILQLGCILHTVPRWRKSYKLRVAVFVEYESDVEEEKSRVKTLLENLRMEAEVLVFWLASGELKTYEIIVNGDEQHGEAEATVNDCLKEEEWWQDIRKLRGKHGNISAMEELAEVEGLLSNAPSWPNTSFQHGRKKEKVERFEGLKKFLRRSKRRSTISGVTNMGVSMGMRTHRLEDELIKRHQSYASASEDSDYESEYDTAILDSDDEQSNQESFGSESEPDNLEAENDDEQRVTPTSSKLSRRRSHGDSVGARSRTHKSSLRHAAHKISAATKNAPDMKVTEASSSSGVDLSPMNRASRSGSASQSYKYSDSDRSGRTSGKSSRHSSIGAFTSHPVPQTKVNSEEGPGPSIMFTESLPLPSERQERESQSIYDRIRNRHQPAAGFPAQQSIPLSFNDLPCRAQHVILNELIQQQSEDTAVVFTTLPAPIEGTCENEDDSLRYLSDLEVLCHALPPTLLVHSNSMTVTMNL
ncbi:MAG: hypothetical protein M1834_006284 [Cirrosporium novae-zelandiae]|nr:MAG: hypothetical protein M1834_006284 [Cirrosporium novae-zelandiae]